ncbi:hypothetical protein J7E68_01495 [Microbacterium sp. ISL-103]|uniref:hypothetical protein n=1 Tax=Microbacterium sp. ISL-103 TaxID=2819156 RepID=UPI001BEC1E72|nr:hypothetical protein [Microbacterium sp. ISL-103]MBT2473282.1 hypothetical protein [Microbacterium sp. ISL-103]
MSRRFLSVSAVILATLVITSAAPAFASSDPPLPAACTVGGVAIPEGDPIPEDVPEVISCFSSVEEAEQFIEDGAPGDYEQLIPVGVSSRSVSAAATVTVGKIWTGTSRTGSVLIHWGSGSGCYGVTFGFPSLGSGWNNNVRSAEGFSNCWSSQYDGTSYTGSVLTCAPYCSSLGALAAKTSSIVYRPVGTFG